MLRTILGSKSREQVIIFLASHAEGYTTEIARFSGMDLYSIQKQLKNLDEGGVIISRQDGRKRIYSFNPDYPLLGEIKQLVEKSLSYQAANQPVQIRGRLPSWLSIFFWDYPFRVLSWKSDRDLIIRRLLTEGSWKAVTWLRKQLGDDGLRDWLIAHRGRGLSPRQLSFWSLILNLPHKQAAGWIQASRNSPWGQR
jgi:DNA-binding transcriptional ArsR family regulator